MADPDNRGSKETASRDRPPVTVACFRLSARTELADGRSLAANPGCGTVGGAVATAVQLGYRQRVLVADVSGCTGMAPLAAANIHQHFVDFASQSTISLSQVIRLLDEVVSRAPGARYATACVADCFADGTVELANCGHPWPILVDRVGGSRPIRPRVPSLPLGIHVASPSIDRDRAGPGGRLLIHTGGLPGSAAAKCHLAQAPRSIDALSRLQNDLPQDGPPFDAATVVLAQWPQGSDDPERRRPMGAVGELSPPMWPRYRQAGIGRSVVGHEWLPEGAGFDVTSTATLPFGAPRGSFGWH